jgi:hypothetical protein
VGMNPLIDKKCAQLGAVLATATLAVRPVRQSMER